MPKETRKRPGPPSKGFQRFIVSFEPKQLEQLRKIAFKRAADAGSARPDVSAVVRELVAEGLKRGK